MEMPPSDSYLVVEKMIQQGEITFAELHNLLDTLQFQEQISEEEQRILRGLAAQLDLDPPPSP